jgi:hypothetical protein
MSLNVSLKAGYNLLAVPHSLSFWMFQLQGHVLKQLIYELCIDNLAE